jgi:hypothetical protein
MEEENTQRPRGRPRLRAGEGKRYTIAIRTTKDLRDRLKSTSGQSGRSLAREIELRLEQSFKYEDFLSALDEHLTEFRLQSANRPSRLLSRVAAAAYCAVSPTAFDKHIRPHVPPIRIGRGVSWDIRALDLWLDAQSGSGWHIPGRE